MAGHAVLVRRVGVRILSPQPISDIFIKVILTSYYKFIFYFYSLTITFFIAIRTMPQLHLLKILIEIELLSHLLPIQY